MRKSKRRACKLPERAKRPTLSQDKTERVDHTGKVQSQNRINVLRMVHPPAGFSGLLDKPLH
jgi:hypothetical protein